MKKILLTLGLFVAATMGTTIVANTNSQTPTSVADDVLTGDLRGNKRFAVQVSTNEGGSIEIMGTGATSSNSVATATINTGEDVQLIITPNDGYELKTFYVDGTDALADVQEDTYTITAISKNMVISATFGEVTTLTGDVNGDGLVNSADAVAIYSYIEQGTASGFSFEICNLNPDNEINSADVVALYDIITGLEN